MLKLVSLSLFNILQLLYYMSFLEIHISSDKKLFSGYFAIAQIAITIAKVKSSFQEENRHSYVRNLSSCEKERLFFYIFTLFYASFLVILFFSCFTCLFAILWSKCNLSGKW